MDNVNSSVWLEISRKGKKSLLLGAIYREHSIIRQPGNNQSSNPAQQNNRWKVFLNQWKKAGSQNDTFVIGDTNLDHLTWDNPSQLNRIMTEEN